MKSRSVKTVFLATALLTTTGLVGVTNNAWANKVKVEQQAETATSQESHVYDYLGAPGWESVNELVGLVKNNEFAKVAGEFSTSEEGARTVVSLLKKYKGIGATEALCNGLWWSTHWSASEDLGNAIRVFSTKEVFDCFSRYKSAPSSMHALGYWIRTAEDAKDLANFFSNNAVVSCVTKLENRLKSKGLVKEEVTFYDDGGPIGMDSLVSSLIGISQNAMPVAMPLVKYLDGIAEYPVEAIRIASNIFFISSKIPDIFNQSGEKAARAVLDCALKFKDSPAAMERITESLTYVSFKGEGPVIAAANCLSKYYNAPEAAAQLAYWLDRLGEYFPYYLGGDSEPITMFRGAEYRTSIANALASETVVAAILKFETSEEIKNNQGLMGLGAAFGMLFYDGASGEELIGVAKEILAKAKTREEAEKIVLDMLHRYRNLKKVR